MADESNFIGKQLGSYRIVAELSSGSYGSVYTGKHLIFENDPMVALKILHAHLSGPGEREQFIREAKLLPSHIEQAILKALAKQRADRHSTISTFISALQKSSQQWFIEGYSLDNLKRYEEAIAAYDQAIRINPNFALAYNNKGISFEHLGKKREAQQAYDRAKQLGYSS